LNLPQVSPGAIISLRYPRFHLGLFIFNPFRVELTPGFTWGYLAALPQVSPGAFLLNILQSKPAAPVKRILSCKFIANLL